ncbi:MULTISPECIES: hypothetical protein [unclassified Streptomyces]|uniref:hypothetical protein n=1 Tax=unclassified Streptomyces TaxID=2593676 RepID=UPI000371D851|nr:MULTISPECIES: hypothetical protein [unclassified Streptomyces]MYT31693.1 hypothetical protein [Streptomyces sp. SID8354]
MATLTATRHVLAPARRPAPDIPGLADYHTDLVRPYGVSFDEERWAAGPQIGFPDLADELLDTDEDDTAPAPDLIVVAYALPDLHPFITTASYLNHRFGDRAKSFAVSEQGLLAPFTALQIVSAYQRRGRCRHAVIAVLEQTTLPTYDPLVHDTGLIDTGVLLSLAADGDGDPHVLRAGTEGQTLGALHTLLDDPEHGATLLVTSERTQPPTTTRADIHRTRSDTYCTGVWLELSQRLPQWRQQYETLVLHDADPRSGARASAVIDLTGRRTSW